MTDYQGDFDVHITLWGRGVDGVAGFAARHGLKYVDIRLERGERPRQEMVTFTGSGTLRQVEERAREWSAKAAAENLHLDRVKIEAAPWNAGVPVTEAEAADDPPERYFEHHVKLLLPDDSVSRLIALADLVTPHHAHLSHNARRHRDDGGHERFVTQRCHRVGQETARGRLAALIETLRGTGHDILEVEEEYVVVDSKLRLDDGWIHDPAETDADGYTERHRAYEDQARTAPAGTPGYPATYRPVNAPGVTYRGVFDPALLHLSRAYRHGEPVFTDSATETAWRSTRRALMKHLLGLIAASPWSETVVLRGSVTLSAWLGNAAREPGDLDFVVVPDTLLVEDAGFLDDLTALVRRDPGPGTVVGDVAVEEIWAYERASGRRMVFPFRPEGLPEIAVQADFVFREPLPVPPEPLEIPGVDRPMLAATAPLSLAWKLLWLETDMHPQGKDLYDAVLLAEHTTAGPDLVRGVLARELGDSAADFTPRSVLQWDVDWANFVEEYPAVQGDRRSWLRRLAVALDHGWRGDAGHLTGHGLSGVRETAGR
ncbi:nucleotidyltransferase AbiEii toxin of type IV toxin-antitoxin system [Stackebrandtia albiflava]|uniref:Nucleotidyltransferase AbiEii toxin of type IV toxin-antitoxin system n=1 Tax=Stackebrandtia albiflava TaxID=406432 RepID=A0A562UQX0_9ACTN|nr:nucleotidyl transferase AbiEii/AbiGii toxin family protein [Stackebrandtia albiflava]TWJ08004.1 nucleotidyltransferase AbiEii toxin of type IV toxin-antitoxin system [Stackebrandtia albiflava]